MKQFALAGGFVCAAASVALAFAYVSAPGDPFAPCRGDHQIDVSQIGGSFALTDETGGTVSDTDLVTGPTLIYFGYTFCPDVCPMDNLRNAEAAYLAEERGLSLQTAFVTIDPERDRPNDLAIFTDFFHPDMIGLTGTPQDISQMAETFHVYYQAQEAEDAFYLIDHSTYSYLMMPEYGVVEVVARDVPPETVVQQVACIVDAAG